MSDRSTRLVPVGGDEWRERNKWIIRSRRFHEQNKSDFEHSMFYWPATYKNLGAVCGISDMRVRQIVERARRRCAKVLERIDSV